MSAFTCYATLTTPAIGQISPPYFSAMVVYNIISVPENVLQSCESSGNLNGMIIVQITPPIASQGAVLSALQAAIQAAETAYPSLTFIWLSV